MRRGGSGVLSNFRRDFWIDGQFGQQAVRGPRSGCRSAASPHLSGPAPARGFGPSWDPATVRPAKQTVTPGQDNVR
jgi:hypothetical protein